MFLTYGRFANVATVDYIVFMRNRDECLKEFNTSNAIELFVHHTDLTELVSFETKINNCGVVRPVVLRLSNRTKAYMCGLRMIGMNV